MPHATLLDGFKCFLEYILDIEADYLCGVPRSSRSRCRVNNRMGYYNRHIRTSIGRFLVRVPHLRHLHLRTPIAKRAQRLSPVILDALSRIRANAVTRAEAASLINLVWTMRLPAALLEKLTNGLLPILNNWRALAAIHSSSTAISVNKQ